MYTEAKGGIESDLEGEGGWDAKEGGREGLTCETRRSPEHLAPSRATEADREHAQDPRVRLAEVIEHAEEGSPNKDKEEDDHYEDGPGGDVLVAPEEGPVAAVGSREPVGLEDFRDEEPEREGTGTRGGQRGKD